MTNDRTHALLDAGDDGGLDPLLAHVRDMIDAQERRARFWVRSAMLGMAIVVIATIGYLATSNAGCLAILPFGVAGAVVSGLLALLNRRAVNGPRLHTVLRDLTDRVEALARREPRPQ